ncbi:MAG TPA: ribonuclease HII [Candidatus Thermoplasmatota archaeon]|nr:ribonuclease HII [Candidatus Thermoplasmatota archaeon]
MQVGIDEAGRGPVVGPLVVAGVATEDPAPLAEMGCRDSKMLSPAKREALDRLLRRMPGVRIEVRSIQAHELDAERQRRSLNDIEADRFREIALALQPRILFVDAADVDAQRFGRNVSRGLPKTTKVVSEHKADDSYPIVGAASIVAKVARDAAIAELARRLERRLEMPLGSGYAHDERTQLFLRAWHERFGDLPEGTRLSWATVRDILAPRKATLDEFAPTPKAPALAPTAPAMPDVLPSL